MATLDIRGSVVGETATAIKAPCLVATTGSNIALSGAQAVDGVAVGNNSERVLVKDQTTASQNGIYIAQTGPWLPAADFANNANVALGTLVLVTSGAVNAGLMFEQTCADNPIVIGTSLVAFTALPNATAQAAISATSLTVATGTQTLAIAAGKAFTAGQWVLIQETSNAANQMLGQVSSYSGTSLVVSVTATGGSGTHSDWTVVLTNSPAAAGFQPPVGTGNVTGPGSATSGHVATFSGATGKLIQDGGALGGLAALSSLTAQYLSQSAAAFGINMLNGQIIASVASNALTFTIQTLAGNTPSAADPAWFVFRSATASSGALSVVEVTAALSITVPASSTLGFANATPGRIWLAAVNNAGTVSLAVINCLAQASTSTTASNSVFPLAGWGITTVTAFGAGANSAQILYGASALSGVPYGVLGYASYEAGSTLATAGSWSATPTRMELYRPGVPLPGQVVQSAYNQNGAVAQSTNVYTISNTAPAPTNGALAVSQAIAATSSANVIRVSGQAIVGNTAGSPETYAYLYNGTSTLAAGAGQVSGINQISTVPVRYQGLAATLSSLTYSLYYSTGNGSSVLNSTTSSAAFGGTGTTNILVEEVQT